MAGEARVYPFHSGSQFDAWQERNCDGCSKYDPDKPGGCEIDTALLNAYFDEGSVDAEIGRRMGFTNPTAWTWDCPERDPASSGEES